VSIACTWGWLLRPVLLVPFLGSRVQDLCEGFCSSEKVYSLGLCVLLCAYGFILVTLVHEFQMDLL
jgi:hypothetical protein